MHSVYEALGCEWFGALVTGAEGLGFKTQLCAGFVKNLSVHPASTAYPTLFRAGDGGANEEGEWHLCCTIAGTS